MRLYRELSAEMTDDVSSTMKCTCHHVSNDTEYQPYFVLVPRQALLPIAAANEGSHCITATKYSNWDDAEGRFEMGHSQRCYYGAILNWTLQKDMLLPAGSAHG